MKKIIIITMTIGFLAGCSGPPDQQSQKEPTRHPVKADKQYDPWPKHQKSTAKPLTFEDLAKPREEVKKDLEKVREENKEKIKEFAEKRQ